MLTLGLAASLCITLHAQTPATPSINPTGQDVAPQASTPQGAWVMFDDRIANELRLPPEQLQQLRGVDERYLNDYRALGTDPTLDPRYGELTDRRNAEIRKVMDEAMYTTWSTKYQSVPNTIQEQRSGGISTPPPPAP